MELNQDLVKVVAALVLGAAAVAAVGVAQANTAIAVITGAVIGGAAVYAAAGGGGGECPKYMPNVPLSIAHPSVVDATIVRSRWVSVYE